MTPKKENHLIRNCSWKFKCNKTWDSLLETKEYSYGDLQNPRPFLKFEIKSFEDIENGTEKIKNL